jgi:hypothetical protein
VPKKAGQNADGREIENHINMEQVKKPFYPSSFYFPFIISLTFIYTINQ